MGRWRNGRARLVVDGTGAVGGGGAGTAGAGTAGAAGPVPHEAGAAPGGTGVPLEIAASYRARTRGLLGREGIDGALLLSPASSVHTFRMRFAIDVAYLDKRLNVVAVRTMKPGRLGAPRLRARHVLEAEAGAMATWGLRAGTRVTVDTQGPTGA